MIERTRNWLAKKIADFAIEHIADPKYSKNIKTTIALGVYTWSELGKKNDHE